MKSKNEDIFGEEITKVLLFSHAFPEDRQAAYLDPDSIEIFHYIFKALETFLRNTWFHEENVIIKIYDDRPVIRIKKNKEGEEITVEEARGTVEFSLFSFAFLDACISQFSSLSLKTKLYLNKMFESEEGLAQTIITPINEIVSYPDLQTHTLYMEEIDQYNKYLESIFFVVKQMYDGELAGDEPEVKEHKISIHSEYIMLNFPRLIFYAEYYDQLNKERILYNQAKEGFIKRMVAFLDEHSINCQKVIDNYFKVGEKILETIEKIIEKANKIKEGLDLSNSNDLEKGRRINKIIKKVKEIEL